METMTLTSYAKRIGVSQQRVSQYKRDGLLDGCFTMRGRTCLIDVAAADERLKKYLDPAQPARKAKPSIPTPKPDAESEIEKLATEWANRMNAALYEVYVLSETIIDESLKSEIQSHIKAIAKPFRAR